jgi:hypothetical protein
MGDIGNGGGNIAPNNDGEVKSAPLGECEVFCKCSQEAGDSGR